MYTTTASSVTVDQLKWPGARSSSCAWRVNGSTAPATSIASAGCGGAPRLRERARGHGPLHAVEQEPVAPQGRLGAGEHPLRLAALLGGLAPKLLDHLTGLAGVLDIALGVHPEVLGGGRVRTVAVVLHQPLQLGRADLRLGALD